MIVGVGLDLVAIHRIRALRERRGERFLRWVFTPAERELCLGRRDPDPALAARFAAKEAGMKAIGTGWAQGVGWQDLETVPDPGGRPRLMLRGAAARKAAELGAYRVHLSVSHDGGMAAAVVILEAERR